MSYSSIYGASSMPANLGLAADAKSLGKLKMEAGKDSKSAIQETAKQFESLFMRELLKSMREATVKSGMHDSPGGDLGADMLDQQFAVQMSGQPGGLSDIIAAQLTRQMGGESKPSSSPPQTPPLAKGTGAVGALPTASTSTTPPVKTSSAQVSPAKPMRAPTESQTNFVQKHSKVASEVEKATGIPAGFMMGQAGHETGWGKFEIKVKGGAPSHNLFGIKAGRSWTGKVAEVTTTEFVNGRPQKQVARFRAYDSYADSFKDYARLINESPRYAKAREQTGSAHAYASGLQKAGYATDPDYATKLSRAIHTTLAIQREQT